MATYLNHMSELFNIKIIQYGNGLVEIRKYDDVVNSQFLDITEEQIQKHKKWNKKHDICNPEKVYVPFTESEEEILTFEQSAILEERKKKNEKDSLNRTRQAIYKYSRQCSWEYFITLTFNPEITDSFDFTLCMKKARIWFNNQAQRKAKNLQYIFVPEPHESGRWHIHGLLANTGEMSFVDSGHKTKGNQIIYNLDGWKFGFSTATHVTDTHKVSTYITKYITKELCAVTKNKHRYFRSNNIPEPIETTVLLLEDNETIDNYITKIVDSIGVELTYEKTIQGYFGVNYKYFK